jgi:beta-lactamase superfamily II metal-dependent hydrolase
MIVNIYDVGHGGCAYVRDGITGANMLLDCGYNETTGVHPVDEVLRLYGPLGGLAIQNYDEDHMDGLPHLLATVGPRPARVLYGNPSLNALQILALKEPPYGDGLLAALQLKRLYNVPLTNDGTAVGSECQISQYWNPYPLFTNTNNLSLVTFVHGPGFSVLFTGDLERAGWLMLLRNPSFVRELAMVRILVASHHGRESGYCKEAFAHFAPDVVVISDDEIEFETQANCYAKHAKGISWNGGRETRFVLTTRCDGDIRISPGLGCVAWISTSVAA